MTRFTKLSPVYVDNGETVTLPCVVNNITVASWEGPFNGSTDCTTIYYDGLMKYPNLPGSIRLKTGINERIGNLHYDLMISDFSKDNEGTYICHSVIYNIIGAKRYLVVLKSMYIRSVNAFSMRRTLNNFNVCGTNITFCILSKNVPRHYSHI